MQRKSVYVISTTQKLKTLLFFIFSQTKSFLIFFKIFFKNLVIFQEGTFRTLKKLLIVWKIELYSPNLDWLTLRLIVLALKDKKVFFFRRAPKRLSPLFFGIFSVAFKVDWISSCHQLSYPLLLFCWFLSGTLFLCCCPASVTDFRELFLSSGIFLPYTAFHI